MTLQLRPISSLCQNRTIIGQSDISDFGTKLDSFLKTPSYGFLSFRELRKELGMSLGCLKLV